MNLVLTPRSCRLALSAGLGAMLALNASAVVHGVNLGTAAPPSSLGGYDLIPLPANPNPQDTMVSSANGSGASVAFDQEVRLNQMPLGWATWSHGYMGDVYDTAASLNASSVTLTLSGYGQRAFAFYAEPVMFGSFDITANFSDGTAPTQITQSADGNGGAMGFGFFADPSDFLTSITVTSTSPEGFGLGEFYVASVPEPSQVAFSLLTLFGVGVGAVRSYRQRRAQAATAQTDSLL